MANGIHLYTEFVNNLRPFADVQNISVETLIDRLEWRGSYDSDNDPDFFPCSCVCGEELTAEAHQFDDTESSYQSTYLIGSVCAKNLSRELQRRKTVKQLRRFLERKSKSTPWSLKLEQAVIDCRLFAAKVFTPDFDTAVGKMIDRCTTRAQRHDVWAEAACIAYGQMGDLIPIYFEM